MIETTSYIRIYPNPASMILNGQAPVEAVTSLYNAFGQLVVVGTTDKTIDLSQLSNGVYEVVVEYNGIIINKKIIKS